MKHLQNFGSVSIHQQTLAHDREKVVEPPDFVPSSSCHDQRTSQALSNSLLGDPSQLHSPIHCCHQGEGMPFRICFHFLAPVPVPLTNITTAKRQPLLSDSEHRPRDPFLPW